MFALLPVDFSQGTNKTIQKKSLEFIIQLYLLLKSWRQIREQSNLGTDEHFHVYAQDTRQQTPNHQVQKPISLGIKNKALVLSELTIRMTKRQNGFLQPVFMHSYFIEHQWPPTKTTTIKKPELALSKLTQGLKRRISNEL